jgi:hypothetical protein
VARPKVKKRPTWTPDPTEDPLYPFPKSAPTDTVKVQLPQKKKSWGQIKDRYRREPEY